MVQAMANIIKRVWRQNKFVQIDDLKGMLFQAEQAGHTFEISGIDEDKIETALICCAYAIENASEPVIKYLSGNKPLDQAESIAYDAVLALPPVQETKEN
jgi:hypothetical protein